MNNKELKDKIKESAISEMPDVINKIDLDSIDIDSDYETLKQTFKLRKGLVFSFVTLIIFITGFTVYTIGYNSNSIDLNPLETETEIIGFQTVSAAALLSSFEIDEVNSLYKDNDVLKLSETTKVIEDDIELITDYLNLAETVIGDEKSFIYDEFESDRPEYSYAFVFKSMALSGNLIEYYVYYNQSINDAGLTTVSGIMEHSSKTYTFSSSVIETDDFSTINYKIQINPNNYVLVTDISRDELQEFSYEVYKNGVLNNSSEICLTSNAENMYAVMTINQNQNTQLTLQFQRDTADEDNQFFNVSYIYKKNNSNETGEFEIQLVEDSETGNYSYQYNFGNDNSVTVNRPEKGNQKATEDDFEETNNSSNNNGNNNNNNGNNSNTARNKDNFNSTDL